MIFFCSLISNFISSIPSFKGKYNPPTQLNYILLRDRKELKASKKKKKSGDFSCASEIFFTKAKYLRTHVFAYPINNNSITCSLSRWQALLTKKKKKKNTRLFLRERDFFTKAKMSPYT